jgi:hypothetical protein
MAGVGYKKFGVPLLAVAAIFFIFSNLYAAQGGAFAPNIPQVVLGIPPRVIMTGVFVPPEGTVKPGLAALTVSIHKQKKTFVVRHVTVLSSNATPMQILNMIFPPRLVFWGDKELLTKLAQSQMEGKVLKLQGTLYASSGVFFVISEEEVS